MGAAFRAVRLRKKWRQVDVARAAGVSASTVSLIERGHLDQLSLHALRRMATALDIRLDIVARWRGAELDRLLNSSHSALADEVTRWLLSFDGWHVAPEVSFAIFAERGLIDLLAWHAPTGTLLVIELKTQIADVQELVGVMDRKTRLAPRIARERGWPARVISSLVVVAEGPTNRRRVAAHAAVLRAAFPDDGRRLRTWLRQPSERLAALTFFSYSSGARAKPRTSGQQRVRRPAAERTQA